MGILGMGGMNILAMGILNGEWEYWVGMGHIGWGEMGILDGRIYMDTPSAWEVWD